MTKFDAEKVEIKVGNSNTKIVVSKDGDITISTPGKEIIVEGEDIMVNAGAGLTLMTTSDDIDISSGGDAYIYATDIVRLYGNQPQIYASMGKVDIQSIANDIYMKPHSSKKVDVDGDMSVSGDLNISEDLGVTGALTAGSLTVGGNSYARARYPNWVPIETKSVSGASSVTFSSLTGNSETKYLLEFSLNCTQSSADVDVMIYINSTNNTGTVYVHWFGQYNGSYNHNGAYYSAVVPRMVKGHGQSIGSSSYWAVGECVVSPTKTPDNRLFTTNCMVVDTSGGAKFQLQEDVVSRWTNTSDEITSLQFLPTAGTISGTFKLSKWYDGDDYI